MDLTEVGPAELLAEAWRRSQVLDRWQHGPMRHAPMVLPDLPAAPVPPWPDDEVQDVQVQQQDEEVSAE